MIKTEFTPSVNECVITRNLFLGSILQALFSILLVWPVSGQMLEKTYNNPIISNKGVCDPHIHIFNNKAYLFATHDDGVGYSFYRMYDWWLWSSPDLVHWNLDYTLKPEDLYIKSTKNAWAVDGAERNGVYYWYLSAEFKTAVTRSTSGPTGPFEDVLKKPLAESYDPTVFIDDDSNKTPYLIMGGYPYKIARLNNDMISLAEQPKNLVHNDSGWNGDGGYLHKRNGIYYLNGHGCGYSTSTNIYGPYTYRGKFIQDWVDHPTIFTWNNQTYCTFGVSDGDPFYRKTLITYIHYKANGDIVGDVSTIKSYIGVGQYDCSKPIQAEWYFSASEGISKIESGSGTGNGNVNGGGSGFAISNTKNENFLYFPRVLNVAENPTLNISLSSAMSNGSIEVRQDTKNGTLLGTIAVPNTGSLTNYTNVSTDLTCSAGMKNIYLLFKGAGTVANIDSFSISSTGQIPRHPDILPRLKPAVPPVSSVSQDAFQRIEAENNIAAVGPVLENTSDIDGGKILGYIKHYSNIVFNLDFGPEPKRANTFQARVSCGTAKGGSIEVRLDSGNGPLLGTLAVSSTGGWGNWITKETSLAPVSGKHLVYLVFVGIPEEDVFLFNLNWIQFKSGPVSLLDSKAKSTNRNSLVDAKVKCTQVSGNLRVTFENLIPFSRVEIQTLSGRTIARCALQGNTSGNLNWDGKTGSGKKPAPGMHICRITSGDQTRILKFNLP